MAISQNLRSIEAHSPQVIEGLFIRQDARARHLKAPMLIERQAYLAHLIQLGRSRQYVIDTDTRICNIIQHAQVTEPPPVSDADISRIVLEFVSKATNDAHSCANRITVYTAVARSWFRFIGCYAPKPRASFRFEEYFDEFDYSLKHEMGYQQMTVEGYACRIRRFLNWVSSRQTLFASVTLADLDLFLAELKAAGCGDYSITTYCKSLRTFFRYAEQRGWSDWGLSKMIKAPVSRKYQEQMRCPTWKQVRAMLASLDDSMKTHCRAKAILMLASIYGLRCSEIVHLTLDDLDWRNEVLTVRRAKSGKTQQFPLQFEVGEAIIHYLQTVRPRSSFRNVFLTLKTPYRPVEHLSQTMVAFLKTTKAIEPPCAMHAFRHACATELLHKGTSLRGIADFLGHRNLNSVSVYAHCDIRSLRKVANFGLRGVL